MKLNTDVTCFEDESSGLDFILRDSVSHVHMAASKWIPFLSNASKGEVLAIIFRLQLVGEATFS